MKTGKSTEKAQQTGSLVDTTGDNKTTILKLEEEKLVQSSSTTEVLYCYCRQPYNEEFSMVACDNLGCSIEWYHFNCAGINKAPKGKWFCRECREKQKKKRKLCK